MKVIKNARINANDYLIRIKHSGHEIRLLKLGHDADDAMIYNI